MKSKADKFLSQKTEVNTIKALTKIICYVAPCDQSNTKWEFPSQNPYPCYMLVSCHAWTPWFKMYVYIFPTFFIALIWLNILKSLSVLNGHKPRPLLLIIAFFLTWTLQVFLAIKLRFKCLAQGLLQPLVVHLSCMLLLASIPPQILLRSHSKHPDTIMLTKLTNLACPQIKTNASHSW